MFEDFLIDLEKVFTASAGWGLAVSFLAGVIVSFSPCIYPLIPITLGVVGAVSASSRTKGFWLSLVFVLGVAAVYTILGVISAGLGVLFSTFFINPLTYLFLAMVFLVLGASILGIIRLKIPLFSLNYQPVGKKGFLSVFILGLVSGLALIPCNFPVLGAILSLIYLKQNIIYGAVALFLFSLGYGTLLIIIGTFSSLVRKLPKSGPWLMIIHRALGGVFLIMGGYYAVRFINLIR